MVLELVKTKVDNIAKSGNSGPYQNQNLEVYSWNFVVGLKKIANLKVLFHARVFVKHICWI